MKCLRWLLVAQELTDTKIIVTNPESVALGRTGRQN